MEKLRSTSPTDGIKCEVTPGATWSTQTTGYYSALKRKGVLTPATTRMNLRPGCRMK